jgi:hypothetical protein
MVPLRFLLKLHFGSQKPDLVHATKCFLKFLALGNRYGLVSNISLVSIHYDALHSLYASTYLIFILLMGSHAHYVGKVNNPCFIYYCIALLQQTVAMHIQFQNFRRFLGSI